MFMFSKTTSYWHGIPARKRKKEETERCFEAATEDTGRM